MSVSFGGSTKEFEKELETFHALLVKAVQYYDSIFSRMLNGELITKELENKSHIEKILAAHKNIHALQTSMSVNLGHESCIPLHELTRHYAFSCDIVQLGRSCVERYTYIVHRVTMIDMYFKTKVEEYQSFFTDLHSENSVNIYAPDGSSLKKHNDLHLISHHA